MFLGATLTSMEPGWLTVMFPHAEESVDAVWPQNLALKHAEAVQVEGLYINILE